MTENTTWNDTDTADAVSDEWTNEVESEEQIAFEIEGDGFTGTFQGMDAPNGNGIVQAHFENVHFLNGTEVGSAFANAGRDLQNKLKKVPVRRQVRIQWTHSLDTGQASPMRVYSVKWR
jgi:hypothetical protein